MRFIDTHSHLDFEQFDADREQVIQRAQDAGVSHIVVSSITARNWDSVKQLTEKHQSLHAAYGLHPVFIKAHKPAHIEQLRQLLAQSNAVAIGECGLDFFIKDINDEERQQQLTFFIEQLKLAQEFDLPLIIHARKSLDIVLKHLRQHTGVRGVIHSFSGSEQQAKQLIELGFYLGFGGPVTYTRAQRLHRLIQALPLDAMVLESDAPDQPDAAHHGMRNEPAYLPLIAQTMAELRNCNLLEIAAKTTHNAQQLFNLDLC